MKFNSKIFFFSLALLSFISSIHAENHQVANNWQSQLLNPQASFRGSAASKEMLWVAGSHSSAYVSFDQGKTWLNRSPTLNQSDDFRDVEILDEQTVVLMSAGTGEKSRLLISHDQGKHWQLLYQNTAPTGFFDSIAFIDNQRGVLLGDPVDGHFVVSITYDQGKHWQRISPQKLPAKQPTEAAFAASGNTIIANQQRIAFTTGGFSSFVYLSDDFGQTWHKYNANLYQQTATAGGYALALNSNRQLFVLGGDYQRRQGVYANLAQLSADEFIANASSQHGLRTAMACYASLCLATGKLSTDISIDNGNNWHAFSQNGFYTLTQYNGLFLAAGADGAIGLWHVPPTN
jgi:photosystem II stability/assembly factor-like uncharacterized protein